MMSATSVMASSARIAHQRSLLGVEARDGSSAIDGRRRRRGCSFQPRPLLAVRAAAAAPASAGQKRVISRARPLSSPPAARKEAGGSEGEAGGDLAAALVAPASRSWWFRVPLQGAVALVVLAAVDAAYSGDWSRIGAISKETEEALKPLVVALGFFHLACAGVAGASASKKGNSVPRAVLKAGLVGFLAAVEAVFAEEGEGTLS